MFKKFPDYEGNPITYMKTIIEWKEDTRKKLEKFQADWINNISEEWEAANLIEESFLRLYLVGLILQIRVGRIRNDS